MSFCTLIRDKVHASSTLPVPLWHAGGNKIRSLHFERGKRLIAIFFDKGWVPVNMLLQSSG